LTTEYIFDHRIYLTTEYRSKECNSGTLARRAGCVQALMRAARAYIRSEASSLMLI
jgi:hypothetical protein